MYVYVVVALQTHGAKRIFEKVLIYEDAVKKIF